MGGQAALWSEPPDDPADEQPETEAHRALDEAVEQRRLRRWLKGMFGGEREAGNTKPDADRDH